MIAKRPRWLSPSYRDAASEEEVGRAVEDWARAAKLRGPMASLGAALSLAGAVATVHDYRPVIERDLRRWAAFWWTVVCYSDRRWRSLCFDLHDASGTLRTTVARAALARPYEAT